MHRERWLLAAVGLLIAVIHLIIAVRQKSELNLSPTAGGQYPYFQNAERMAVEGLDDYLGDRNRMPLVPALLSLFHSDDPNLFFERGTWFAIVFSMLLVVLVAAACVTTLPPWATIFLTALAAFHVFVPKSAFVQAELAYYAFFFLSWLIMCRVIQKPCWRWAGLAGVTTAAAFYGKASATPLLVAFAIVMLLRAVVAKGGESGVRRAIGDGIAADSSSVVKSRCRRTTLVCLVTTIVVFVALTSPYLWNTKEKFGHYFYNVNSTFFMWTDSWSEAQEFAKRHNVSDRYPDAPFGQIPGANTYMQAHTTSQMARRMTYGMRTLAGLAVAAPHFKYFVIVICACVVLALTQPSKARSLVREYILSAFFTILLILGYGAVFSWYAVVSYGDRFLLSLYLPVMFALTWILARSSVWAGPLQVRSRRISVGTTLACAMIFLLLIEGVAMVTVALPRPNERFVEFYFNESREAQLDGDLAIAIAGYRGVLTLEPTFAPAHHELAIIALQSQRADEAIEAARAAVDLAPTEPNYLNTYGSALLQAGRAQGAVVVLERAVQADPDFASAWYNLGGAHVALGQFHSAKEIADTLRKLDSKLAGQLEELIPRSRNGAIDTP